MSGSAAPAAGKAAPVLLAIDCGTQSLRALAFAPDGSLIDKEKVEYQPYFSAQPGWAEQDPTLWWESLLSATSRLFRRRADLAPRVAGIGVTTQRDTMICLDRAHHPLRPAILWLDQRTARAPWRPDPFTALTHALVGMTEPVKKTQEHAACNWIMQNQPEIWERTAHYAQVSGFLHARLTGEPLDSVASQIGHMPFDYQAQNWANPRHLNAKLFPVEPGKLMRLVPPGSVVGKLRPEVAASCGLPAGIPVVACGSDKGCETIGMGVAGPGAASLSFGTTATVQCTTRHYYEPLAFMPAYPAPIPGCYNPEVEIFRGYWMITWFKNQFAWKEVQEATQRGIAPEAMLEELLHTTPPGAMGLVMQPYWTPGLRTPSAKGSIIGFGDVHTRAHLYRSIVEGLAFGLLDGLHSLEKRGKSPVHRLTVSGGASQSDQICRISANVFGRPIGRGATYETSGLGAAMIVAAASGCYRDIPTAVAAMSRIAQVFEPEPDQVELYQDLYRRVYSRMYGRLKPLYEEIRDITNYPEKPGAGAKS